MRIVNRLLALFFGLALLTAAVVLVIEVVADLAGTQPVVFDWRATYRWAQRTSWDSGPARLIGATLALVGLVLLLAQFVPRRPGRIGLQGSAPGTDAAITRRGLARTLADAVNDVDGVTTTRVVVRRRSVRVKARARTGLTAASARDGAADAARRRLDGLNLRRPPRVTVDLATGGG